LVKGKLEAIGKGETLRRPVRGKPRAVGREMILSHPARGTPRAAGKGVLGAFGRWALSGPSGAGAPRATGEPGDWHTGQAHRSGYWAPVGGRAAQRTLSNQRDGVARLGEAPPSHVWRGLVPLCPTLRSRARTDTPARTSPPTRITPPAWWRVSRANGPVRPATLPMSRTLGLWAAALRWPVRGEGGRQATRVDGPARRAAMHRSSQDRCQPAALRIGLTATGVAPLAAGIAPVTMAQPGPDGRTGVAGNRGCRQSLANDNVTGRNNCLPLPRRLARLNCR
jgi:hypothetical protein